LEQRLSRLKVAVVLTLIATTTSLFAFTFRRDWIMHVLLTVVFLGATATLEPCLKSLGSLFMPQTAQGRSFGIMATITGAGQMAGSSAGAYLYHISSAPSERPGLPSWLATTVPSWLYQQGALPLLVTSLVMLVAWVCVTAVSAWYQFKSVTSSPPSPPQQKALDPSDVGDLEPLLVQRNVVLKHPS
jgi:hypothetical protein